MTRKPPKKTATKKPAKPKAPAGAKSGKPKVVPITKGKPRRRNSGRMLFMSEMAGAGSNGKTGPKLFTRTTPFDELLPDPAKVLAERKKRGGFKTPPAELIGALRTHIRGGVPVPQALALYGVTSGEFREWQIHAQRDYADGISSPFVDFMLMLEILEAQGEALATLDARTQRENVLPLMRIRYARNWDPKMAGANDGRYIAEPEVVEAVADEDAAYLLAILEQAHGGRKPGDGNGE